MIVQRNNILIILIFSMLVSNCGFATTADSSKETSFELLYPDCSMNSTIVFLPLQPNYKFENFITLSYKNTSQNQIALPPDSGVKILIYEQENSKWVEVNNNMQYSSSPKPYIVVDSGDGMSSYRGVVISPDISDNPTASLRVAIMGHIYLDGILTPECVGAFIDIQP